MLDWEDALVDKGYIVSAQTVAVQGFGARRSRNRPTVVWVLWRPKISCRSRVTWPHNLTSTLHASASTVGLTAVFMALSCALKGHGLFKMAIAVAPVTSWRFYDTIYTEIYNGLPQYNAAGYDDYSPLNFARMLDDRRTRLLLIHGTADDNVHFQHTAEMARIFNRIGKRFDMMVYPDQNHSMRPDATQAVRQKMVDYTFGASLIYDLFLLCRIDCGAFDRCFR